ncbi:MAG: ABC transporter permease [Peptococcaceae bacterium]|nr:ABC transporter permease [Peptococcaceae bacterium]
MRKPVTKPEQKRKKSKFGDIWRRLKKNKAAMISLFIITLIILVAVFADIIAPYPYEQQDYSATYVSPSLQHPLGTDKLGRDTFSRLIYGTRQSIQLGIVAIAISTTIGITIGAIAGYYGGWTDNLVMRGLDIYQSIPMFLLCVTLAALMGPSLKNAIIAIGISMVPIPARMMRASILSVREMEYIEAAKAINAKNLRIILKHIIPNAISPLIVSTTMSIGMNILAGAQLSFIGLGAQPPLPEWGTMISDARNVMRDHGELALYPGVCIMITVLAFNLLGDGLRDALDPRLKN